MLKIGEKYFIDLELAHFKLKYPLLTANAKAKYDRKKKTLRISIPVDPSYKPPQEEVKQVEDPQLVEEETWKNKVLDFAEPDVAVQQLTP